MLCDMNWRNHVFIIVCVCLTTSSMGCRSTKLGSLGMFGFNSEPSAEVLASNGPPEGYPAPPSESATPEAIASIAGGTVAPTIQPTTKPGAPQLAASGNAPSYVSNASSSTNPAAAMANGFYGNTKPVGFSAQTPTAPSVAPPEIKIPKLSTPSTSGYEFGSNNSSIAQANVSDATGGFEAPTGMTAPTSLNAKSSEQPSAYVGDSASSVGGMTLPGKVAANLSAALPQSDTTSAPSVTIGDLQVSAPTQDNNSVSASPPKFSISDGSGAPSSASSASAAVSGYPSSSASGYSPGSTSGSGYPSSAAGGSTFR